jgi:hypothetical protein
VYAVPRDRARLTVSSNCVVAAKQLASSKNYFTYGAQAGHLFGGRGSFLLLTATKESKGVEYGVELARSLWERLDNYTTSNRDKVGLAWTFPKTRLYDNLTLRLFR